MKKIKIIILSLLMMVILPSSEVSASHAMGADLTYKCVGPNQYLLTYSFYRDCSGISAPPIIIIDYWSSCYYTTGRKDTLYPTMVIPDSLRWVYATCPGVTTTCAGGSYTGIEEWIYTGIVDLPGACSDWTFAHSECCRNSVINTIPTPDSKNLYVYSKLNNLDAPCNNSPTFSNNPVPFACVGQQFCFNHGATDIDGDSLTYQLIAPLIDPGTPTNYFAPFSQLQPVISSPPVFFNPLTGDICMYPTQANVTVFAVLVSEYRNGILIGQVERDIQLTVNACTNTVPTLTGMDGTPTHSKTICANTPFSFWVASIDGDITQSTTITWDSGIPQASFITTNTNRDSGQFIWTPTIADISTTPYCFTITVKDNNCPYLGQQVYSFCLTVCGITADAGLDQSIGCVGSTNLYGKGISSCGGSLLYNWLSPLTSNDTLLNVSIGCYQLEVSDGLCKDSDIVCVSPIPSMVTADFTSITNCNDLSAQFTDQSVGAVSLLWDFGDGNTSVLQNPTHIFLNAGTYNVTLKSTDTNGCVDSLVKSVSVNTDIPIAQFAISKLCYGDTTSFFDASIGVDIVNWVWDFGDGNTSVLQNPTHIFLNGGQQNVMLHVTNNSGCVDSITNTFTIYNNPVIAVSDTAICYGDTITLMAPGSYEVYEWIPGGLSQSINIFPIINSSYTISVTDINNCKGIDAVNVSVKALPLVNFNTNNDCFGKPIYFNNTSPDSTLNFIWDFGDGNISSDINPIYYYSSPGNYQVSLIVIDNNGCDNILTIPNAVQVYANPDVKFGSNELYADETYPVVTFNNGTNSIGEYNWSFGDSTTSTEYSPTHRYPSIGVYNVQLTVIDTNGCVDSISNNIEIRSSSASYRPNSFTPNGDGKNDVFKIYTYNVIKLKVEIFDRWGLLIYSWDGINGSWDGTINGNPAQADVYIYKAFMTTINGKDERWIGSINLVR